MPTKPPYPVSSNEVTIGSKHYTENSDTLPSDAILDNMRKYLKAAGYTKLGDAYYTTPLSGFSSQAKQLLLADYIEVANKGINAGAIGRAVENVPKSAVTDLAPAEITSVTQFLSRLVDPHTWLRVAEVLIGIVLVGVALAKMSPTVNKAVKLTPAGRLL